MYHFIKVYQKFQKPKSAVDLCGAFIFATDSKNKQVMLQQYLALTSKLRQEQCEKRIIVFDITFG